MAASAELTPQSLKGDAEALTITWSDGATHRIPWCVLREKCPCATCRTKRAEPPQPPPLFNILKPQEAAPVRATQMTPIGNYAYGIHFSDGHNSGIYSVELLREIGHEATKPD